MRGRPERGNPISGRTSESRGSCPNPWRPPTIGGPPRSPRREGKPRRADADDAAVRGAEAPLPGLPAAVPPGRLLRALLPGRPDRLAPAPAHADVPPEG